MSNGPRRRRRPRPDRGAVQLAVQVASMVRGCTCQPTSSIRHRGPDHIDRLDVRHDATCPAAIGSGPQVVILPASHPPRCPRQVLADD